MRWKRLAVMLLATALPAGCFLPGGRVCGEVVWCVRVCVCACVCGVENGVACCCCCVCISCGGGKSPGASPPLSRMLPGAAAAM
jgi:hypothetical protein